MLIVKFICICIAHGFEFPFKKNTFSFVKMENVQSDLALDNDEDKHEILMNGCLV